jgi:hypothetical protein
MRLSFSLATTILLFVSSAQSQPVDSLMTTSIWEFFPNRAHIEGDRGFGIARHRERAGKLYPLAIQSSASLQINLGLCSSVDERQGSGHKNIMGRQKEMRKIYV